MVSRDIAIKGGRYGYFVFETGKKNVEAWKRKIEDAGRLLAVARIHHQKIRKLAKRLYNDIKDIRGGKVKLASKSLLGAKNIKGQLETFLMKSEVDTLVKCNNLNSLLDEARAIVQQALTIITGQMKPGNIYTEYFTSVIRYAFIKISEIIKILRELFLIDKQVEAATERYINA